MEARQKAQEQAAISPPPAQTDDCPVCKGAGVVGRNVPFGHEDFGRAFVCPECRGGVDVVEKVNRALERQFGDMWLFGSPKIEQYDLDDFLEMPDVLKLGKADAINAVYDWSERVGRSMVFLYGEAGNGKTCLASAGFMRRVKQDAGLPVEYNALMNTFLSMVVKDENGKDQDPYRLIRAASTVGVLFLDDLGNTFVQGKESPGRQRWLFEILNHRYNHHLPTIITSNLTPDGLYRQFDDKVADRITEYGDLIEMKAPSLRFPPR